MRAEPIHNDQLLAEIQNLSDYCRKIENQLAEANHKFRALVEDSHVGLYIFQNHQFSYVNPRFAEVFGYTREEFLLSKANCLDLFVPDDQSHVKNKMKHSKHPKHERVYFRAHGFKKDQSVIEVEVFGTHMYYEGTSAIIGTLHDLKDRKQTEQLLEESEQRFRSLFENNPDAVFSLGMEGIFETVNPGTEKVTGYSAKELLHKSISSLIVRGQLDHARHLFQMAISGEHQTTEVTILHKKGHEVQLTITIFPMLVNGIIVGIYGIAKDITEHKHAKQTITRMAYFDALTDLPNRRYLQDKLSSALAHSPKHADRKVALLLLDIDRFKMLNDSFGPVNGDQVLQIVGKRLSHLFEADEFVARMGGDEFALVLQGTAEEISQIAENVLEEVKKPFSLSGHELHISASIGISVYPDHGTDADTLMKHAEVAMYRAKELGGTFQFYIKEMNEKAYQRLLLENDLRRALCRNEFFVQYQPRFSARSGQISCVETLVRWNHPEFGVIAPSLFIPIAEEIGLITEIDQWVLKTACAQNQSWQNKGLSPFRIAVNFSARQFQRQDLVDVVTQVLQETGLPPKWLEIEITESTLMHSDENTLQMLHKLQEIGIHISIDDFGTGYSSLNYLRKFHVNTLKIDQSFVQDISQNVDNSAIACAIISLAHTLRMNVVAEGVETEDQQAFLRNWNCDEMQGYLLSRPITAIQLEELLT